MILSKRKSLEKNWDLFVSHLQSMRGQGLWRGSFSQVRPANELRIPLEPVGSHPEKHELTIFIKPQLEEISAMFTHREEQVFLKDYDLSVDKFLSELLKEVRQRTYIRTNKDKANYRSSDPPSSNEQ